MKPVVTAACGHRFEIDEDSLGTAGECPECGCIDSDLGSNGVEFRPEKGDVPGGPLSTAERKAEMLDNTAWHQGHVTLKWFLLLGSLVLFLVRTRCFGLF